MILLITLLSILAIVLVLSVLVVSITGAVGIVMFGDVIVCVFVIWKCFKHVKKRISKKK